jgi:hypothetical protein
MAAFKQDLMSESPKMRRAGSTDVSDLEITVNALTSIAEPHDAVDRSCPW